MIAQSGRLFLLLTVCAALFMGSIIILKSVMPETGYADVKTMRIDINSATLEQLTTLPGIGAASSQRIIEGRPYAHPDELIERSVISQTRYDKIKDHIMVKEQ